MRRIALSVVMTLLGMALIAGGVVSIFPIALIGFDPIIGTHASVAAAALGIGLCLAAWNPAAHITWVRIGIIYSGLVVLYEIVLYFYLGIPLAPVPLIFGVGCGVLLVALYPRRMDLLPKSPTTSEAVSPPFAGRESTA